MRSMTRLDRRSCKRLKRRRRLWWPSPLINLPPSIFSIHLSTKWSEVLLAADYVYDEIFFVCHLLELINPALDIGKALPRRDVVDDDGSIASTIVHWRHASKSLLSCRVPYLQPTGNPFDDELLDEEASSDGRWHRLPDELSSRVAMYQGRLAGAYR